MEITNIELRIRPAGKPHTCLCCEREIEKGKTFYHFDRKPFIKGKHEERAMNFHTDCWKTMHDKFHEQIQ